MATFKVNFVSNQTGQMTEIEVENGETIGSLLEELGVDVQDSKIRVNRAVVEDFDAPVPEGSLVTASPAKVEGGAA
jgi:hypothetical protein